MLTSPLTVDEKLKFFNEHFLYEIQQLFVGTHVTSNFFPFWVNIRLEIFLLHVRGLYEFFYNDSKKYEDDACAFEFVNDVETWRKERPAKTEYIINVLKQIDKELAHLTYGRHYGSSIEKININDIAKINDHLLKVMKAFADNVPSRFELINGINKIEACVKSCVQHEKR